jgi:hypothetical protein
MTKEKINKIKNKIASIGSPILQEVYMNLLFICDFNLEEFEKLLDDNDKNILKFDF